MRLLKKKKVVRLSFRLAGTLMTPEEFDAVEECDRRFRYELINGVLVVTPPALDAEVGPNETLGVWLYLYKHQHPQGAALDATLPEREVRAGDNRRRADRVIWAGLGRQPDSEVDPPTIAIEFVSAQRRDRERDYVEKRKEYAELGISEYWIIDRFERKMTAYLRRPTGPQEIVVVESETYRTDILPGFELPLAKLLAVADQWKRKARKRK